MYDLINSNITRLLQTVNRSDVDPYIWMIRELHNRDVSQDQEFQREYCSYRALNGAGLGQPFRSAYFSLSRSFTVAFSCRPSTQTTRSSILRSGNLSRFSREVHSEKGPLYTVEATHSGVPLPADVMGCLGGPA